MKKEIKKQLNKTLKKLNYIDSDININISEPKNKKFGDLSTNISFDLSKKLKKSPIEIAEVIKNELTDINLFSNVSAIKPGFIKFNLNPQYLNKNLFSISVSPS